MKKLIYAILLALLITGCTTTVDNKEASTKILAAITETNNQMNYTLKNDYSQTNDIDGEKVTVESSEIIHFNNNENKQEISVEESGSYNFLDSKPETTKNNLWYKEGKLYLKDDQKRVREVNYDEFSNLYLNSPLNQVLNQLEYSKVIEKQESGIIHYELTLTDNSLTKLANAIAEGAEVVKAKISIQLKDGKMIGRTFTLDLKISAENISSTTTYTQTWSSFNETTVSYPDDLESYTDVTNSTGIDTSGSTMSIEDSLITNYNYKKQEDGTIQYDWGTEKYIFDFDKKIFTLATETHSYDYNWGNDVGKIQGSACTYDFTTEKAADCTDEEVENILLAKEVFSQELNYSGVSLDALQ